ncbi:unnamed protein product [Absidia cylindrospora]
MTGPPSSPSAATLTSNPPSYSSQCSPSSTHHHQRSISDLSTATTTSSSSRPSTDHPNLFPPFNNCNHTQNHHAQANHCISTLQMQPSVSPSLHNHHQYHHHQHQRQLSHRRAISATTADYIMEPSSMPSSSSSATTISTPPTVPPLPFIHRAHSNSPPENYSLSNSTKPQSVDSLLNRLNTKQDSTISSIATVSTTHTSPAISLPSSAPSSLSPPDTNRGQPTHAVVNGMELPRDISGRYLCPFCQKAFSRPSSLRIHTYSHTKEKPFACPECPRQFSVQSNMRRHLRIHLIRPSNKSTF